MNNTKANLNDLKVNPKLKLTEARRKAFVKILEDEFVNQTTALNANLKEAQEKVIIQWKKDTNWHRLVKDYKTAQAKLDLAAKALEETGLDSTGSKLNYSRRDKAQESINKLDEKIDRATTALRIPHNIKNKLITKLNMCEYMGEAQVILTHVLGNGILPQVEKKDLLMLTDERKG